MSNYPCSFDIITISGGFENFDLFKSSQVSNFLEKKNEINRSRNLYSCS